MNRRTLPLLWPAVLAAIALTTGCGKKESAPSQTGAAAPAAPVAEAKQPAATVDGARIAAIDNEPAVWLSTGRNYGDQRFSPLDKINDQNVSKLGLAWTYKVDVDRGAEATPLVVDGVMYTTGAYSILYALDAKTGQELWKYDPQVPRAK